MVLLMGKPLISLPCQDLLRGAFNLGRQVGRLCSRALFQFTDSRINAMTLP
jgi:hypothetical protein